MNPQNTFTGYNAQPNGKSIKKKVVLLVVAILLGIIGYWLSTISFIEISVSGLQDNETMSVQILNQGSLKTSELNVPSGSVKKRVAKGDYEVLVKQSNKSFFAVVKARGLFQKAMVAGQLQPEKSRRFIADGPENCMNFIGSIFVSYACSDIFSNIKIHLPATNNSPTYVLKTTNAQLAAYTEGIIKTKEGYLALILWPSDGEAPAAHFIYRVGQNLKTTDETLLKELDANTSYAIKPYKEGFIVYDTSFDKILYYPSIGSSPTAVATQKPKAGGLQPVALDIQQDTVLTLHASSVDTKKARSEAVVTTNNQSRHFTFKKGYSAGKLCGSQKMCLIGSKTLDIYDIGGSKPVLLFAISGVSTVESSINGLLVVRKDGVLRLDIEKRAGFMEYSFGGYSFNSMQVEGGGYVASLTGYKSRKVALLIDQQAQNSDSIDKKVLALQKMSDVNVVSANGTYIFISPNLGELVYNDGLGGFDYDPVTKKTVNDRINAEIDRLQISRSVYKIINTSE